MSAIYHQGTRYSFKSDSDVAALIAAMAGSVELQALVRRFSPSGSWCVSDGRGGYLMDENGGFITETMDAADLARYSRALAAIDGAAVRQADEQVMARSIAQTLAFDALMAGSKGSTGQPWAME